MLCHVIICNSNSWCGPFKRVMLFSFVSPCYCCGQIPEIWELDHPVGGLLVTHMNVKFIWVVCVWFEILWKVLTPLDDWNAILFHASSSSSYRSVTFFSFGMSLTNHCDWLGAHDSTAFCGKVGLVGGYVPPWHIGANSSGFCWQQA